MPVEPGVVDANVLIYAVNEDDPYHARSRALLDAARESSVTLYVTSQILCEFYSVITNARRVQSPSAPAAALKIIESLLVMPGIRILPAPQQTVAHLLELLKRRAVSGAQIFDLQIVATMLANNIERIYTFNAEDFKAFSELVVVSP